MKFQSFTLRLVVTAIAVTTCALFAPWWGTPIVIVLAYLIFRLPTRVLCTVTFAAWVFACAARDIQNDGGPSRVMGKMLSLQSIGLLSDSLASRLAVFALVGAIGFLLALFTGGLLKSLNRS